MQTRFRRATTALLLAAGTAACSAATTAVPPAAVQPGTPGDATRGVDAAVAVTQRAPAAQADVHFMQGMIHHHAQALEMTALVAARTQNEDIRRLARRIEMAQADEIEMMQRWLRVRGLAVPEVHLCPHHAEHGQHRPAEPGQQHQHGQRHGQSGDGGEHHRHCPHHQAGAAHPHSQHQGEHHSHAGGHQGHAAHHGAHHGQRQGGGAGHHGHGADHLMPGMLSAEEMARLAAATGAEFDRLFLQSMIRHHEGALVMVADLFAGGGGHEGEIFQFASHVDSDQRVEIARMQRMLAAGG